MSLSPETERTLIEPVRSGDDLAREIAETEVSEGGLAVWWLGQSGYLFKSRTGLLGVDLYLSEHLTAKYAKSDRPHVRMTRAPIRAAAAPDTRVEVGDFDAGATLHQGQVI